MITPKITGHHVETKLVKPRSMRVGQRELRAEARVEVSELRQHEDRHHDDGEDREEEHDDRVRERALDLAACGDLALEVARELLERFVELAGELGGAHDGDVVAGEHSGVRRDRVTEARAGA